MSSNSASPSAPTSAAVVQDAAPAPLNFCRGGGSLAAVGQQPSSDPADYDAAGLAILGCNRLRCRRCGAFVRLAAGLIFKRPLTAADLQSLFDLPALAASPLLSPASARLHLCRCHAHQALQSSSLLNDADTPEPDAAIFASLVEPDWQCAGHPLFVLPRPIDGVEVTPENIHDRTVQSLRGQLPPAVADVDRFQGLWAARLYVRMAQTPWQSIVGAAVLSCMTDPAAQARLAALNCLQVIAIPGAQERALSLLQGDRTLFVGGTAPATEGGSPVATEQRLWQIALPLLAQPGPARELAKQDALTPGRGNYTIYSALAKCEPDWVATHLDALTRAHPEGLTDLLRAVQHAASAPDRSTASADLQTALLRWARARALQPGGANAPIYALLASRDRAWLASQLDDLLASTAAHIEPLVEAIDRHGRAADPAAEQRLQERLTQQVRQAILAPDHRSPGLYARAAQRDGAWFAAHLDALASANPTHIPRILQAALPRIPDAAVRLAQAWLAKPGTWSADLYEALARSHPDWLATHAQALAGAHPQGIPSMIRAIHNYPSRFPNWQALVARLRDAQPGTAR